MNKIHISPLQTNKPAQLKGLLIGQYFSNILPILNAEVGSAWLNATTTG
jgi:hypothetical protein